ncbi:MAG: hypothetical protein MdMp014T_2129 [Treponematales bacterium]
MAFTVCMVSVACFLDETEPKVKDFYAVCKTLNITMEQAVAGEKGAEYVREWARNDGETWQPPDRIKDVVDVLGHIDDDTLETVRTMVLPLMAKGAAFHPSSSHSVLPRTPS